MADELKQLTQRIKNSADKRYALKGEASAIEVPTQDEINGIFNKIVLSEIGSYELVRDFDSGFEIEKMDYADEKGWLFVVNYDDEGIVVYDVNNNYNQVFNMAIDDADNNIAVSQDAKRMAVVIDDEEINIYQLKADESGYDLVNTIDIDDDIYSISMDASGKTLAVAFDDDAVDIYELDDQGNATKVKGFEVDNSYCCEISKDGNYILIENEPKIYEARKINGVWTELYEVIKFPLFASSLGENAMRLTADKKVLFADDKYQDKVYIFHKCAYKGGWEFVDTIESPIDAKGTRFGYGMAISLSGDRLWVNTDDITKIYEYRIKV
jgi:hypothetical protein